MPKVSPIAGSLSAEQFDAAVLRHPRLTSAVAAAARAVLVEGKTLEAAAADQFSRQRLHKIVRKLYREAVPAGWECGFVALPPELMEQVRAWEAHAREQYRERESDQ